MLKFLMIAVIAALSLMTPVGVIAQSSPKAVRLLVDVGPAGSPFRHEAYAARATDLVTSLIVNIGLQDGDLLEIRTFGNPSLLDHLDLPNLNVSVTFEYRGAKVEDIGSYLAEQIGGLGAVTPHAKSDLMAALGHLSRDTLCDTHDVSTILMTNGIQVGEVEGLNFILHNPPSGEPFCGSLTYLGLWVDDPQPIPGMQPKAESLFIDLATMIGFDHADIVR